MTATEPLVRLAEAAALGAPVQRKRMLIIANPSAATMTDRTRNLVVAALHGRYEVEAMDTQARGHATDLCLTAANEGYDVIVSFGGDGTANEIANGLIGCATPVTCLPGGATNVLCKMLGIPGDIVDATEHLLGMADSWNPRQVDLGTANGRAFTYTSGFGIDASVVKRIEQSPRAKRHRLREYFFVYAAVETVLRHYIRHPPRMEVHVDGRSDRVITTIVQNAEQFTYLDDKPIAIAEGAGLQTGTLAGVALRGVTPVDIPSIATRLLSEKRSVVGHRQIVDFRDVAGLRCVSVDGRPIPLHADGDHLGDVTEAVFGVLPGALAVVS
ncbi:MAG TPA: diacylglycerol kinase family protein [Solirubrobacteraceae bacterium]|nr:diacylglycerol kinase family protein [Solirubrobacteraceae bacterium]